MNWIYLAVIVAVLVVLGAIGALLKLLVMNRQSRRRIAEFRRTHPQYLWD